MKERDVHYRQLLKELRRLLSKEEEREEKETIKKEVEKYIRNLFLSNWDIVEESLSSAFSVSEVIFEGSPITAVYRLVDTVVEEMAKDLGEEVLQHISPPEIAEIIGNVLSKDERFDELVERKWNSLIDIIIKYHVRDVNKWKDEILRSLWDYV